MSLRDLFRDIQTEQSQEKSLPKTNSIIVKNISGSNLDLNGVFPTAVDFVLQSKSQGLTAVVTFKTPEEAAEIAQKKVTIDGQEILPKLLVDSVKEKKSKPQKDGKRQQGDGEKKKAFDGRKKRDSVVFEMIPKDGDIGKKLHLWKLTKNIKLTVRKNLSEIKKEQKFLMDKERKSLLGRERLFLRSFMVFLENRKHKMFNRPSKSQNYPYLNMVQKDELLSRLRGELLACVDQQINIARGVKMRQGDESVVAKFTKEIHFLHDCRQMLTRMMFRKKSKKPRRETKTSQ